MPRWVRVVRGMIGTGLTFGVGVGVVGGTLGLIGVVLGPVAWDDLRMVARMSVVAFLVGVVFSGVLAITARNRSFEKLSLRFVTALGVGGGLLYFLFIGFMSGFSAWTPPVAVGNLALLTVLGGVSAAAMLLLARRASAALSSGDEPRSLGEGSLEVPAVPRSSSVLERRNGPRWKFW